MRFKVGQVYECIDDGRQAVVAKIRGDGREGLLRFTDTGAEEWFLWAELHQAGKWHLKGGPK
jgi:hypothetical protein